MKSKKLCQNLSSQPSNSDRKRVNISVFGSIVFDGSYLSPFIAVSKESGTGSGLSSQSSSSGVLVPGVDDKDVDWGDDDLDLNDDDMTEEEVKVIMQNIAASSKEKAQDQGGGDLDVSLMSLFSATVRTLITFL